PFARYPGLVGGQEGGALVGEVLVERPGGIAGRAREPVRIGAAIPDLVEDLGCGGDQSGARLLGASAARTRSSDSLRVPGNRRSGARHRGILAALSQAGDSDTDIIMTSAAAPNFAPSADRDRLSLRSATGATAPWKDVLVDGVRIAYDDEGAGPVVVCL